MEVTANNEAEKSELRLTWIVYILYAAGIMSGGFFLLVGLIAAHIKSGDMKNSVYASHIKYLIRTGWISIILSVIGILTVIPIFGFAVLFVAWVWLIYRVIKGMLRLNDNKAA